MDTPIWRLKRLGNLKPMDDTLPLSSITSTSSTRRSANQTISGQIYVPA